MVMRFGFSDASRFTATLEAAYGDMLARKYAPAATTDWREPLALIASAGDNANLREEWARRYGRPEFAALNRMLSELGSGGLGIDNGAGGVENTGERWLLDRLVPLMIEAYAPVVIDVGAHEGGVALDILRAVPQARLHALEPQEWTFQILEQALAGTGASASRLALGSSVGTLRLHNHGFDGGTTHASPYGEMFGRFYGTATTGVDVPMMTLDAYCEERGITRIDLLKIDTEGHELEVLRGAQRLLRSGGIRLLLFEFNYTHIFSRTFFSDFFETLPEFVFFRLLPAGLLPLARGDWGATEVFRYQNVLALPEANRDDLMRLLRGSHD
jgi:FkbM family methyltransferase